MSSRKEKQVLEQQRALAARLKASKRSSTTSSTTGAPPPSSSSANGSSAAGAAEAAVAGKINESSQKGHRILRAGGLTLRAKASNPSVSSSSSSSSSTADIFTGQQRRPTAAASSSSSEHSTSRSNRRKPTNEKGKSSVKSTPVIDLTSPDNSTARQTSSSNGATTKPNCTGNDNGNDTKGEGEVKLGIHKSFKRTMSTSAAVAAAARKKAKLMVGGGGGDTSNDTSASAAAAAAAAAAATTTSGTTKSIPRAGLASRLVQSKAAQLASLAAAAATDPNDSFGVGTTSRTYSPDDFWKNIRNWDFVSDLADLQLDIKNNDKNSGGRDDGGDRKDKVNTAKETACVPNTFINSRHYISVWAPLCMAECRAQLLSDFLESQQYNNKGNKGNRRKGGGGGGGSAFVPVAVESTWKEGNRRRRGDDYFDSSSSMSDIDYCNIVVKTKNRGDGEGIQFFPHDICALVPADKVGLVESLLVRPSGSNSTKKNMHVNDQEEAFRRICMLGNTESHRKCVHGLILTVSKRKWAQVGTAEMYLVRLGANITALREFTALCNVDMIPLKNYLLGQNLDASKKRNNKAGAKSDNRHHCTSNDVMKHNDPRNQRHKDDLLKKMGGVEALGKGFFEYAKKKFNPSQLMAISASSQGYGDGGFTLIKGPPGTGKTTTLVNILNALHIRQYNKYYDEVRRILGLQTGARGASLEIAKRSKPRLLVCAPSNAAVDNVILKIMEDGFIDGKGNRYNPSMIRVGVGQSLAVKDVALENKVDHIISENLDAAELESSINGYKSELQRISMELGDLRKKLSALSNASPWPLSKEWEVRIDADNWHELQRVYFVNHVEQTTTFECPPPPEPNQEQYEAKAMPEYKAYMARAVKNVEAYFNIKSHLEQALVMKGSVSANAHQNEIKQALESHVLNSVHIVMTTLGTAGNRAFDGVDKFEVVVVDEAAQSVEPATLSALQLGSRHCVMVGDPQQLPATIFNVSGRHSKYDRSLFQRLEEANEEYGQGDPAYMLDVQYRMHPQISHFPRHIFYKGALKDGPNVKKPDYGHPLIGRIAGRIPTLKPFTILDLDSKEERGGTSLSNSTEAHLAVFLYQQLQSISDGMTAQSRVAVITPYAQQAKTLRRCFSEMLGDDFVKYVEVNTVDAFQGREAKIVIFSAVRAAGSRGIGFLSDVRRMNVALTRAKHFLFVIARCKSIVVNPYWKDLVEHARGTNAVVSVPILGKSKGNTQFPSVSEWRLEHSASNASSVLQQQVSLPRDPRGDQRQRPPPPSQQQVQTFGSLLSQFQQNHSSNGAAAITATSGPTHTVNFGSATQASFPAINPTYQTPIPEPNGQWGNLNLVPPHGLAPAYWESGQQGPNHAYYPPSQPPQQELPSINSGPGGYFNHRPPPPPPPRPPPPPPASQPPPPPPASQPVNLHSVQNRPPPPPPPSRQQRPPPPPATSLRISRQDADKN